MTEMMGARVWRKGDVWAGSVTLVGGDAGVVVMKKSAFSWQPKESARSNAVHSSTQQRLAVHSKRN